MGRSEAFGLQAYGVTWGPAKIGPPIGWLSIAIRLPVPSAARTVSVLGPTFRPETSPS
jgi:hypothetical protein